MSTLSPMLGSGKMHSLPSGVLHSVEGPPNGPILLLLHGVTRCWRDWEPILPELINDWHVIALDHRGHGASARTPGEYRVINYATHVAEFVRSTFTTPITVFGHSLGAMVALQLAADCPELVDGVILEDPPFHTMGREIGRTPYQAQFAGMQAVARGGGSIDAMTGALAEIRLPGANGEVRFGDIRDRAVLRFSAECLEQVDPDIFTSLVAGAWLDGYDHAALWCRVKCPLLLLQGDSRHGGALSDAEATLAEEFAPSCQLVRFEGVGHQIHRNSPAHVGAVIRQWVRRGSLPL